MSVIPSLRLMVAISSSISIDAAALAHRHLGLCQPHPSGSFSNVPPSCMQPAPSSPTSHKTSTQQRVKDETCVTGTFTKKKTQKIHKLAGRGQTKFALPPPYPHAIVSSQRPSLHLRPAISQKHTLKGGGGSHCLASGDVVMPCTRVPPLKPVWHRLLPPNTSVDWLKSPARPTAKATH